MGMGLRGLLSLEGDLLIRIVHEDLPATSSGTLNSYNSLMDLGWTRRYPVQEGLLSMYFVTVAAEGDGGPRSARQDARARLFARAHEDANDAQAEHGKSRAERILL